MNPRSTGFLAILSGTTFVVTLCYFVFRDGWISWMYLPAGLLGFLVPFWHVFGKAPFIVRMLLCTIQYRAAVYFINETEVFPFPGSNGEWGTMLLLPTYQLSLLLFHTAIRFTGFRIIRLQHAANTPVVAQNEIEHSQITLMMFFKLIFAAALTYAAFRDATFPWRGIWIILFLWVGAHFAIVVAALSNRVDILAAACGLTLLHITIWSIYEFPLKTHIFIIETYSYALFLFCLARCFGYRCMRHNGGASANS